MRIGYEKDWGKIAKMERTERSLGEEIGSCLLRDEAGEGRMGNDEDD